MLRPDHDSLRSASLPASSSAGDLRVGRVIRFFVTWSFAVSAARQSAVPAEPPATDRITLNAVTLEQVDHHDSLTGAGDHFGCLLYDTDGGLVRDGERRNTTWLYTGALVDGKWVSFARRFDLTTLKVEPRRQILDVQPGDKWATVHLAVQVGPELTVLFFSTGAIIKAAVGRQPDGPFSVDPQFVISPSQPWETGCSLESDGGMVPIENSATAFRFWKLYDTLARDNSGNNGWAEVHVDKQTGRVRLAGKHPQNPLPLRLAGRVASRTGGNLDHSIRFGDRYPLFYLSKPDAKTYRMSVALSDDPLFQTVDENRELAGPLGTEQVIEKFQTYLHDGLLCVIYDVSDRAGDWRTGLRRYRINAAARK